jgi:hypothetical protein
LQQLQPEAKYFLAKVMRSELFQRIQLGLQALGLAPEGVFISYLIGKWVVRKKRG